MEKLRLKNLFVFKNDILKMSSEELIFLDEKIQLLLACKYRIFFMGPTPRIYLTENL